MPFLADGIRPGDTCRRSGTFSSGDMLACWQQAAAAAQGTKPRWSGRGAGRAAGGLEEVHPVVLAVPAVGQVNGDVAAAVPGDAAATLMSWRRMVAPRALAWNGPACTAPGLRAGAVTCGLAPWLW
jgi:hypothetical protein